LKCLGDEEARVAMGEVHEGMCGMHQSAHKMRWALRRAGLYWLTMLKDCFRYYKGCEACQKFKKSTNGASWYVASHCQTVAIHGLGFRFCGRNSFGVNKRASLHISGDRLFHEVSGGSIVEKYDSQGSYSFCAGEYNL
jgi:hypothetical protein